MQNQAPRQQLTLLYSGQQKLTLYTVPANRYIQTFRPNPHCLELVLILGSNWDRFFIKRDQDEFFAFTLYTRNSLENQLTPGITDAHRG